MLPWILGNKQNVLRKIKIIS